MDIFKAVLSLQPSAKFSLTGNEYENLIWFDENELPPPTKKEVLEEAQRLQKEFEAKEYQRQRALEYPDLKELADALYWNYQGNTSKLEEYYSKCEEVKNKYPKPQ
jgi:uncharacterized coiled-coil DUF342 family protein